MLSHKYGVQTPVTAQGALRVEEGVLGLVKSCLGAARESLS